jgi:hypothetical protein
MPAGLLPITTEGTIRNHASYEILMMVRDRPENSDRPVLPLTVRLCLN